jgi:hypothetical protein
MRLCHAGHTTPADGKGGRREVRLTPRRVLQFVQAGRLRRVRRNGFDAESVEELARERVREFRAAAEARRLRYGLG